MDLLNPRGRKYYPCNLQRMLKKAGMTQSALAAMVGMNAKGFYRITHGQNIPLPETAAKIAKVMRTTEQAIWPDYDRIVAERAEMHRQIGRATSQIMKARREAAPPHKADKSAYHELWKYRTRGARQDEGVGPALPITIEDRERDLVLRARHMKPDQIEDDAWCRRMAALIHNWILNNTVWGIYRHLRAIMAAEQMAANERAERAAAGGGQ